MPLSTPSLKLLLGAALAALLGGCIPFPYEKEIAPQISGVVLQDGRPVAGAEIVVQGMGGKEAKRTITDAAGRFFLAAHSEIAYFYPVYGDWPSFYRLDIQTAASKHVGLVVAWMGRDAKRYEPITLICDLAHPVSSETHGQDAVCRTDTK